MLNCIKDTLKDSETYSKEYIFEVINCIMKSDKLLEEYCKRLQEK